MGLLRFLRRRTRGAVPGVVTSLLCVVPSAVGLAASPSLASAVWTTSALLSVANHATRCRHPVVGPADQAAAVANGIVCLQPGRHPLMRAAAAYVAATYALFTRGRGKRLYEDPLHLSGHLAGLAGVAAEAAASLRRRP